MTRRWRVRAALLTALAMVAGCSSTGVEIARSDQRAESTQPTEQPDTTPPPETAPIDNGDLPAVDPVAWSSCANQESPWECGAITVPMDYSRPGARQIAIALTRLPAADPSRRIGSLVLNPGGPGGSGLELAYGEAEFFPPELLDRFDIVGFDPRGVGGSTAVECPDDYDFDLDPVSRCIDMTGELLSYLGTPNVARDLEMIRKAVGDRQLTYVGFSYGTALGAVYDDMFPGSVRALVLDGAVDPNAGEVNETENFGDDYYADQDFERTIDAYHELCNATRYCAAAPHSKDLLERVESSIRDLPTAYFDGGPSAGPIGRFEIEDLVYSAMYSARYWPVLAVALKDADDGDASTIAALYSYVQFGYPANMEYEPNFDFAHLAIQCADFAGRGSRSHDCQDFPETAEPLPDIDPTDTDTPVLVVGTLDDPATPGRYAPRMAAELGDAVAIEWEGAGHTAFLSSLCVDEIVVHYLIDLDVPDDGTQCPFVVGADTLSERADVVFGPTEPHDAVEGLTAVLVAEGQDDDAARCIATQIVRRGDQRLIVHLTLGVQSPELVGLEGMITRGCG